MPNEIGPSNAAIRLAFLCDDHILFEAMGAHELIQ
jgi:hypothetical protein